VSAHDLAGRQTWVLNVHQIAKIDFDPVESDEDSAPETIWDTEGWLNCNGDFHNPNQKVDNCKAEVELYMEPDHGMED
jgi:hypothetical protein